METIKKLIQAKIEERKHELKQLETALKIIEESLNVGEPPKKKPGRPPEERWEARRFILTLNNGKLSKRATARWLGISPRVLDEWLVKGVPKRRTSDVVRLTREVLAPS